MAYFDPFSQTGKRVPETTDMKHAAAEAVELVVLCIIYIWYS